MLTTNEITNKKFEKKMGGYKAVEVNSFLMEVSSTISQLNRENADLKRKIDIANKKLGEYESEHNTLSQVLLNAHRMSETVVKDAQAKADLTVRYAEIRAEKIAEKVRESIVAEQEEFVRLKKEIVGFRSDILDTYKKHIELILSIPTQLMADEPKNETNEEQVNDSEIIITDNENDIKEKATLPNDVTDNNEQIINEPTQAEAPQVLPQKEQKKETNFKLNLKFDDESGEYIPTDTGDRRAKLQSLKFGTDYDISLDENENTGSSFFKKKK